MPEGVWKAYIDFEIENVDGSGNYARVRALYERLLEITQHVKVWISYAQFEHEQAKDSKKSRAIFTRAYAHFKDIEPDLKEERVMILENWLEMEISVSANSTETQSVRAKLPKRVKKRRETSDGWEEYYDYIFPDDQAETKNIKILQMAHQWKEKA